MKKALIGACTAIVVMGCAKTPVQVWDQTHITYNAVTKSAMAYAELPGTEPLTAKLIADIVLRTAGVIEQASLVADQPQTDDTARYLTWADTVVKEAFKQLEAYLLEQIEDDESTMTFTISDVEATT